MRHVHDLVLGSSPGFCFAVVAVAITPPIIIVEVPIGSGGQNAFVYFLRFLRRREDMLPAAFAPLSLAKRESSLLLLPFSRILLFLVFLIYLAARTMQ